MQQQHSEITADIRKMDERFESRFGAQDVEGLVGLYADDAIVLAPGLDLIQGRKAIQKYWKEAFASGIQRTTLKPFEVERFGDLAVDVGRYTMLGADGKVIDEGQYLITWKYVSGTWLIHRDTWVSRQMVH